MPRHKRGEIWQYLSEQNRSWDSEKEDSDLDMCYEELLKQLTSHQHAILIDIGEILNFFTVCLDLEKINNNNKYTHVHI